MDELLDWIGRRLELEWVTAEAAPRAPEPAAAPAQLVLPPGGHLRALDEQIELGFPRGIHARLEEIEKLDARHGEFVAVMSQLARQFQFDAMREIIPPGTGR